MLRYSRPSGEYNPFWIKLNLVHRLYTYAKTLIKNILSVVKLFHYSGMDPWKIRQIDEYTAGHRYHSSLQKVHNSYG
jgi:hypothetical protein